jgi:hypothetical protein
VAGEGDSGKARLAVVSVLTTAAVGIAGAGTTLLVSRDQRATERANRIYERRAGAYVDAIDTLELHMKVLDNLDWSRVRTRRGFRWEEVKVDDETDVAQIGSRLLAFGSTDAIAAFHRVGALDKRAFAWVFGETHPPGQTDLALWKSKTSQAIDDLRDGLTVFEKRLNHELTS